MKFEILTIFPDFFNGPMAHGIVRRAAEAGLIEVIVHDLRAYTRDKHLTVDDRTFGGGEGMVLKPEPIFECADLMALPSREERISGKRNETVILLTPSGALFRQDVAESLAKFDRIVLICGRYEGVDERVSEHLADRELSIGDYVLSGGELGAAVVVDAVTRLLPGAVGNVASVLQESFSLNSALPIPGVPDSTCGSGGLLDYPHYTRPASFRGMNVPEVLGSGKHDQIRRWRRQKSLEKTWRNRPDLLRHAELSAEDRLTLDAIIESGKGDAATIPGGIPGSEVPAGKH